MVDVSVLSQLSKVETKHLLNKLSMHIAAMKPTVLSYKELDEQFVKDELAQLNHVIDQDNESRAMVNKPALPH